MKPGFGTDYQFRWKDLGDIAVGRPNLGAEVPVAVYRLGQYTMREALARRFGDESAAQLLREAGWIAGCEFCRTNLDCSAEFPDFVSRLQELLKDLKIGVLRVEMADPASGKFTLTVSEDLDCSGLSVHGHSVCEYDEGFISGVFYAYTGRDFNAVEVDCWATGDRTCRFAVTPA